MNAQHPIRAAFGHLATVAPSLDAVPPVTPIDMASYERGRASGSFSTAVSAFDMAAEAAHSAAFSLRHAADHGATVSDFDREALGRRLDLMRAAVVTAERALERAAANASAGR